MMVGSKIGKLATDVALIVLSAALIGGVAKRFYYKGTAGHGEAQEIRPGDKIRIEGVNWGKSAYTLLIGLSTTCPHCQASIPFYRQIAQHASAQPGHIQLLAVSSEAASEVEAYLRAAGVSVHDVLHMELAKIGILAIPTLVLADQNGVVKDMWVGELSAKQQRDVSARLEGSKANGSEPEEPTTYIDQAGLNRLESQGVAAKILDIRDREPYAVRHRPGAVNIPYDELETRAEVELLKRDRVAIDCEATHPIDCESAAGILKHFGFLSVSVLGSGSN